jgi:putative ABC transport system ATP-binding protein
LSESALIAIDNVSKDYVSAAGVVHALRDVTLHIASGEFVAIVGTSGSGKSTLMNILGCLDRPTRGTYELFGTDVGARTSDGRAIVRNRLIGFIFQGFNLLSRTSALENVELPLSYRGIPATERKARAEKALRSVGLGDRMDHTPNQLSGGQQQRVAIARALVTDPPLLLADEPTGNLDTRTSLEVLALLQRLNQDNGITICLVTHEPDIAACAARVITFRDGTILSDVRNEAPKDAARELALLRNEQVAPLGGPEVSALIVSREQQVPASVYLRLAFGTALGLFVGVLYTRGVLGLRTWWIPPFAAILVEGLWGASYARKALGQRMNLDQTLRVSLYYTLGMGATFGALLLWWMPGLVASFVTSRSSAFVVGALALSLCALSLVRFGSLTAFSRLQRKVSR